MLSGTLHPTMTSFPTKASITSILVSISPIFYEEFFHTKVFCAAFTCLHVGFVIFWRKDFGAKAAHKMVVKLTPGVFGETGKMRDAKLRRERRDVPVPGTGDAPVVAGLSEVVGRIGVYPE